MTGPVKLTHGIFQLIMATCSWMIFPVEPQSLLPQALRKKNCYNCKVQWCLTFVGCLAGSCSMSSCDWLPWCLQLMLTVLSVLNGQLNGVLFVDGLRIGITIKLSFATGILAVVALFSTLILYISLYVLRWPLCINRPVINWIATPMFMFRCQIAVHQECYGARAVQDLTTWLCRACESPQRKRECCLCPIKGIWLLLQFLAHNTLSYFATCAP